MVTPHTASYSITVYCITATTTCQLKVAGILLLQPFQASAGQEAGILVGGGLHFMKVVKGAITNSQKKFLGSLLAKGGTKHQNNSLYLSAGLR